MTVTITEALRIKNEISKIVQTLQYQINTSAFGTTQEDGETISKSTTSFVEVERNLLTDLSLSENINNTLSQFNKSNNVDAAVRKLQNAKMLLDVYTRALPQCKSTVQNRFENLSTERKSVKIIYTPFVPSKEMKGRISAQKAIIREQQTFVETANQQNIDLSFDYSDFELLVD
jgi:hypothetical protein